MARSARRCRGTYDSSSGPFFHAYTRTFYIFTIHINIFSSRFKTNSPLFPSFFRALLCRIEYDAVIAGVFGASNFRTIVDLYPSGYASDCRDALTQLVTDYVFTCASRHLASVFSAAQYAAPIDTFLPRASADSKSASREAAAKSNKVAATGSQPAYLYLFDHVASFDFWEPDFPYCSGHNCHGEELPFLFQTAPLSGAKPSADENSLSATMVKFWGSLAHALTPGAQGRFKAGLKGAFGNNGAISNRTDAAAAWPPFDLAVGTGPLMRLAAPASNVMASYRPQFCAMWDSLGYHWD